VVFLKGRFFYDDLLSLDTPTRAVLVGFTDDVALLAVVHTTPLLEELMNNTLAHIDEWMMYHQLTLDPYKSEAVMLIRK